MLLFDLYLCLRCCFSLYFLYFDDFFFNLNFNFIILEFFLHFLYFFIWIYFWINFEPFTESDFFFSRLIMSFNFLTSSLSKTEFATFSFLEIPPNASMLTLFLLTKMKSISREVKLKLENSRDEIGIFVSFSWYWCS